MMMEYTIFRWTINSLNDRFPLAFENIKMQAGLVRIFSGKRASSVFGVTFRLHREHICDVLFSGRYLERSQGSMEFNSTACKELRQEITDVKVLTMWVCLFLTYLTVQTREWAFQRESDFLMKVSSRRTNPVKNIYFKKCTRIASLLLPLNRLRLLKL